MPVLRSLLFTPGSVPKMVRKALDLPADAIIFDLEDAVAISEKVQARQAVREALDLPRRSLAYVRVNGLSTHLTIGDLEAVVCGRLDGVVFPKAESAADIHKVDWFLEELEIARGLTPGSIDLIPIVETARGVDRVGEILSASPRVKRVSFGAVDYTTDLGIEWSGTGQELFWARMAVVNGSRAAGKEPPLDTVYPRVRDPEGFEAEARLAKALGFQGKALIHPDQIEPANRIFSPSPEEVAYARKVVAAFAEAEARGSASITVDGRFVDYPVYAKARRVLAIAELMADRGPAASSP